MSAEQELEFHLEIEGEQKVLTRDQLVSNVHSPNPDLRQAAYRELFRGFGSESSLLGQIYIHRLRDWYSENVQLRSFSSPIAVRNTANDIPDEAVESLLEVVREKSSVYQRFFRPRGRWWGVERLRRSDLTRRLPGREGDSVLGGCGPGPRRLRILPPRNGCQGRADLCRKTHRQRHPQRQEGGRLLLHSAAESSKHPGYWRTTPARWRMSPPWPTSSAMRSTA